MRKIKENMKLLSCLLWIAVSVGTLFISIVSYTPVSGEKYTYAIQDLLDGTRFSDEVLDNYTGEFYIEIGNWALILLCAMAILAILAALVGVIIMSKQKSLRWPYIMTILGVVGTAIPSIAVFTVVIMSISFFEGTVACGFYPIVTPIAMTICLITVISERRTYKRKLEAAKLAGDLIRPAGNL